VKEVLHLSKINKISVDGLTYDIEDKSVPSWAKNSAKPTYKTSELENDSNFITEAKVDEKIANVASGGSIDLSNYATKKYVDEQISNIEVSGGSSLDIFSTEEQVIGTWVDGKPLYRKVVQYTLTATDGYPQFDTGIRNIEYAMMDMYKSDGGDTNTNYFRTTPASSCYLNKSNGLFTFILVSGTEPFKAPIGLYTFIIKYTKTTD
jgi:hypothetical protein